MNDLDIEYQVLLSDVKRVIEIEEKQGRADPITARHISARWVVANESLIDKVVYKAADLSEAAVDHGVNLSAKLISRSFDWFEARRVAIMKDMKDRLSIARHLQTRILKLQDRVKLAKMEKSRPIEAGKWLNKLCIDEEYDLDGCIHYADKTKQLDNITKGYTVLTANAFRSPRRTSITGNEIGLVKLSRSSGRAIKRAAPMIGLGAIKPGRGVEAFPLPGNVIIAVDTTVKGVEAINFAKIDDSELPETITSLSKSQAEEALQAAYHLTEELIERDVSRRVFSYSGIYKALDDLKNTIESGDMDKHELIAAKKRLANAIAIEDAITTSMVRVCQGLVEIVSKSV